MAQATTANRQPVVILTYHQIAEAPPRGAPFRGLYVSPAAFARQMSLLHWLGYRGLSMSDLEPYLIGARRGKVVGITFDDGYLNNLEHALPVLQWHGFSATCYAVSQLLGQTNAWDRTVGVAQTALMNPPQLRHWVAGGQEVGAHTRNHARLTHLDQDTGRNEIQGARAELEQACGARVTQFCYPYGDYGLQHLAMVREAGYSTATTTRRGRCHAGADLLQLPRVPVVRSTNLAMLWLKLATGYEDRRGAQAALEAANPRPEHGGGADD